MDGVPDEVLAADQQLRQGTPLGQAPTVPNDVLAADRSLRAGSSGGPVSFPDGPALLLGEKQKEERPGIYSGGVIRDVFDTLSAMQYAAAGAAHGIATGQNLFQSAWEGVQNRASWEDVLDDAGVPDSVGRTVAGLAGDIILDPMWVLSPAKLVGVLAKVDAFKAVGTAAKDAFEGSKVGQAVLENLVPRFKLPGPVGEAYDKMLGKISADGKELETFAKDYQTAGKGTGEYLKGMLTAPDIATQNNILKSAEAAGVDSTKLLDLSTRAEKLSEQTLDKVVDSGVMSEKKVAQLRDLYELKDYHSIADVEAHAKELQKIGGPVFRARAVELQDYVNKSGAKFAKKMEGNGVAEVAEALDEDMGRVSSAAAVVIKNAQIGQAAAAEQEFMGMVAKDYGTDLPQKITDFKIPSTQRMGDLQGKFVPREIGLFIDQKFHDPTTWEKLIATPYNWWKMFKVTVNPAAQARNFFANLGLINIAGVPAAYLPYRYGQAITMMASDGAKVLGDAAKDSEAAKAFEMISGKMEGTFVGQELKRVTRFMETSGTNFFQKMGNFVRTGLDASSTLYKNSEILGKTAAALHAIDAGMDAEKAVAFGEKALFNYSETPRLVDILRRKGIVPFGSFAYFATNATAQAAWANPAALTKYAKIMDAVEAQNPQAQQERASASEYMRQFGQVFTPLKDKYNRNLVFNASYLMPFQDVANAAEGGIGQKLLGMTPFVSFFNDLARNQSAFTGKPITPAVEMTGTSTAMKELAVSNYIDYIYKFSMPSWMPSIIPGQPHPLQITTGGYAFKNLEDAMTARPDVFGHVNGQAVQDWKAAVMGEVFGLKTKPYDLTQEQKYRSYEYKDAAAAIFKQMKRVAMDETLTVEQKQRLTDQYKKDLVNVHRGWRATP